MVFLPYLFGRSVHVFIEFITFSPAGECPARITYIFLPANWSSGYYSNWQASPKLHEFRNYYWFSACWFPLAQQSKLIWGSAAISRSFWNHMRVVHSISIAWHSKGRFTHISMPLVHGLISLKKSILKALGPSLGVNWMWTKRYDHALISEGADFYFLIYAKKRAVKNKLKSFSLNIFLAFFGLH